MATARYASTADLVAMLKARINYETSQKALAAELDISESYLSDVLNGKRGAGPTILKALGFEDEPFYRRQS
jgi:predicted transcriptional regulator